MTEYRDAFRSYLRTGNPAELRAMGAATGSAGGYLLPEEYQDELTVTLKSFGSLFRDMREVPTVNGRKMLAPVAQFSGSGVLVSENPVSPITAADRVYQQVILNGYTIASGVHQVSLAVEQDSGFPMESVIAAFGGEMIGRKLADLSANGSGTAQPTGVYAASGLSGGNQLSLTAAQAVTIDSTASTELTSKAPSPKTLLGMVAALDPAYADEAKWYMDTTTYGALCRVTDTNGQPLIRVNGPRVLHGFPIQFANELSPLTASTVSGPILANLNRAMYWRNAGVEVLRLSERYADVGQMGYVAYGRGDMQPRDVRALVALKAAAT